MKKGFTGLSHEKTSASGHSFGYRELTLAEDVATRHRSAPIQTGLASVQAKVEMKNGGSRTRYIFQL